MVTSEAPVTEVPETQDYQSLLAEIEKIKGQLTEAAGAGDVDRVIDLSNSLTKTKKQSQEVRSRTP